MKKIFSTILAALVITMLAGPASAYILEDWTFDLSGIDSNVGYDDPSTPGVTETDPWTGLTHWKVGGEVTQYNTPSNELLGTFTQTLDYLDVLSFGLYAGGQLNPGFQGYNPNITPSLNRLSFETTTDLSGYYELDGDPNTPTAGKYYYGPSGQAVLNYWDTAGTVHTLAVFTDFSGGGELDDGFTGGTGSTGTVNLFAQMEVQEQGVFFDQFGNDLYSEDPFHIALGFIEGGFTIDSINPIVSTVTGEVNFAVPLPSTIMLLAPAMLGLISLRMRFRF